MPNFMKSALRAVAGLAILGVGVAVMNGLIGMKPEPVISNRPVTPRAVRSLAAEVDRASQKHRSKAAWSRYTAWTSSQKRPGT